MKPSGIAILVLSALLALCGGWIVYSALHGSAESKAALAKINAGIAENQELALQNASWSASNAQQQALHNQDSATIAQQKGLIANLKAQSGKAKVIAGAAISESADLQTTYKAGAALVAQISEVALNDWYSLLGTKVDPLLASVADFTDLISSQDATIDSISSANVTLDASNTQRGALIDADVLAIADQKKTIDSQALDLVEAKKHTEEAIFQVQLGWGLAITFGVTTAGLTAYELGRALKWW